MIKSFHPGGGVKAACRVAVKAPRTAGCIVVPSGIEGERFCTDGCVQSASGVVFERKETKGRVIRARCVMCERIEAQISNVTAASQVSTLRPCCGRPEE